MQRVNFKVELPDEVVKERNQLIHQLKKSGLVLDFCKKTGCDLSLVESYPYKFKRWIDCIGTCQGCTGLHECSQEVIGKVYDLKYDDYLDFVLTPCRYAKKKKEEEAHLEKLVINDMPSRWYNMKLENLDVDKDNKDCIIQVREWLRNPDEVGFYLHGNVGTGKSTLAACACNYFARNGKRVAFVNVPNWVARMKGSLNESDEIQKQIRILQYVDFLVLDDIGAESGTAWVRDELLFPILNWRMEEKKWTWFTSNEDMESLYDHYMFTSKFGEEKMKAVRIMERIKTLSKVILLTGKNRRNV